MEVNINNDSLIDPSARKDMPESFNKAAKPPRKQFWGKKFIILGLMVLLLVVALAGFVWFQNMRQSDPKSENVFLTSQGPQQAASGNEIQYIINYRNGENADLIGVSLEVFYPPTFKFKSAEPASKTSSGQNFDLPVLRQGQDADVVIKGKLSGPVGSNQEIRARLRYKFSNFNSEFSVEYAFSTTVLAPNLTVEITGPIDVTNGQNTTFSVNYSNVSGQDFENATIQVQYPAGFKYNASNPPAIKNNNTWNLGTLPPSAKGKIDINGSFTGDPRQEKMVVAELGVAVGNDFAPQVSASVAFKIVSADLSLIQKVNPSDYTNLGKTISYVLEYGNYGTVAMTNVVVTLKLEGSVIDFNQLKVNDAIITGNTLTWKAATLKSLGLLSPNQEGSITFSVPLKSSLATNIKNQVVRGTAAIYSNEVKNPVSSPDVEVKLASQLELFMTGKYVSGALPMQVGQPTVFSVTLTLTNFSNDLEDVELIGSIPLPDSAWKNIIIPDSEKEHLSFDVGSNNIRWKVGNMPAFTGRYSPARTVTFHLEVVPSFADKGSSINLIREIQVTGRDTFVNQDIESTKVGSYRTSDLDDERVDNAGDTVQ